MRKIVAIFSHLEFGYAYFDVIDGDNLGLQYGLLEEQSPGFIIFDDTSIGRRLLG